MAKQKNSRGFTDFLVSGSPIQISVAIMAVFSGDVDVEDDETKFVNADLDGRTKVSLKLRKETEVNGPAVCLVSKKISGLNPEYHQIILRLPGSSKLARENEDKLLEIKNEEKGFGYYFLKVQTGIFFRAVFVTIGKWKNYQVSVIETDDDIQVILFSDVEDIPDCLKKRTP